VKVLNFDQLSFDFGLIGIILNAVLFYWVVNFRSPKMKSPNILLSIVAAVTMTFGVSTYAVRGQCTADLNGDGQINQADVAQLLANSGPVPFPTPVVPTWATLLEASPDPAVVTDANLRAAIMASGFAWRVRDNSSNIEMLLVPGGTFMMGCSPGDGECANEETPHQVTLTNAFYMGKTEVTWAQWHAKMGIDPYAPGGPPNNPVEKVSWDTIQSFNSATGLRLPTEEEWEYACRAGTTTARYGDLNAIAWYSENSSNTTHSVATKLPNALGLYDTLGNVYEWCQSWYFSLGRVLRGGALNNQAPACGCSRRYYSASGNSNYSWGFRAARNP
jgi:formylglycine-generating enzyme required for sulfatase activity